MRGHPAHPRNLVLLVAALLVFVVGCAAGEDAVDEAPGVSEPAESPDVAEREIAEEAEDAAAGSAPPPADAAADVPDAGRLLVREGSLTLIHDRTFDEALDELVRLAERLGGGVGDVRSGTGPDGAEHGTVEVEVPVEAYDELLAEVAGLGEVERRDIRTVDVTGEHVDLTSRLRHAESLEEFYLGLYDDAETVEDALAISEHLERAQQRVEELRGRLDALEERAATSTLHVELVPEGYDADELRPDAAALGGYWDRAADGFVQVVGVLLVVTVAALPLLAVAALAVAVVLGIRRYRHRPAA